MRSVYFTCLVWLLFSLITAGLIACSGPGIKQPDMDAVKANNRGVALMGQFDFESAYKVFSKLSENHPDNSVIRVNQAIALLNRQGPGDELLALELLSQVLAKDKTHVNALYCSGLVQLHMGRLEKALSCFSAVFELDPEDPEVLYFKGKTLGQLSRYDEALSCFYRSLEIDQYISSAYYSIIMIMRRLGKRDEAMAKIQEYQKFKDNPRARILDFKYTKMGKKAEAVVMNFSTPQKTALPGGPLFNTAEAVVISGPEDPVPTVFTARQPQDPTGVPKQYSIILGDINGDNRVDLFIPNALDGQDNRHNAVLLGTDKSNAYRLAPSHPFAGISGINTVLLGDVDNDGLLDAYLCRKGENQLWFQERDGFWDNVTKESLTDGGALNTVDGALFDADHDGDLDIFLVNSDGPNELLNNNRDTRFRPLAKEYGLSGSGRASGSILLKDLDNDRDVDIIIVNDNPPHEVYINQRLWNYDPAAGFDAFINSDIKAIASGDLNSDGSWEIYTLDSGFALSRWTADQDHHWRETRLLTMDGKTLSGDGNGIFKLALSDYDGDGTIDILASNPSGFGILSFKEGALETLFSLRDARHGPFLGLGEIATPSGPGLMGITRENRLEVRMPGPGRYPFCTLSLSGRQKPDKSIRTNASGIGTKLAVRNGSKWTVLDTLRNHSGPGQSYQPLTLGMNRSRTLDFLKVEWPDGVFQTEIDLGYHKNHEIVETQRQMSSCPVLFAWNGDRFEFVSDILGVGGIGYNVGPGVYAEPRPWENFMLPEDLLKPDRERLIIKLTEPMEEVEYLDSVALKAYDIPPGWSMTLDERMGISAPFPTGDAVFYKTAVVPEKAINDRQEDVTDAVLKTDFIACPPGRIDTRFIGRLEKDHQLTLIFSEALKINKNDPVLIMDGWVEYPYSQTSFAAWQAGAAFRAPTIEIEKPDGQWEVLLEEFGYPAGMPRQMSVPLSNITPGVKKIRITTNQEIYWDRISIAYPEACPDARIRELDFKKACLEQIGFPTRIDFEQHRPYYDFSIRKPVWDTNLQDGFYTKPGDILELVDRTDNALAIIGPGESIQMEFAAIPEPRKNGWNRVYVIETRGWCKDMDLFTNTGETVEPVPSNGLLGNIAEKLNEAYNIRYLSGRL